jgi:hypothetical protein
LACGNNEIEKLPLLPLGGEGRDEGVAVLGLVIASNHQLHNNGVVVALIAW